MFSLFMRLNGLSNLYETFQIINVGYAKLRGGIDQSRIMFLGPDFKSL
jgi:hypothetical protein